MNAMIIFAFTFGIMGLAFGVIGYALSLKALSEIKKLKAASEKQPIK